MSIGILFFMRPALILLLAVASYASSITSLATCQGSSDPLHCGGNNSYANIDINGPLSAQLIAGAGDGSHGSATLSITDTLMFQGVSAVRLFFDYSTPVIYAAGSSAGFTLSVNSNPVLSIDSARLATQVTLSLVGHAYANSSRFESAWGIQTAFTLRSLYGIDTPDTFGHDIPQNHIASGFTYASESGLDYPVFGATRIPFEQPGVATTHNPEPASLWMLLGAGVFIFALRWAHRDRT